MAKSKKKSDKKKPSPVEIAQLKKAVKAVTKAFFSTYGDQFDLMLVGPPGPRPPPKLELKILNLSSF